MAIAEEAKPYLVFLKVGTALTNIKDKTQVTLSKGIYANVLAVNPDHKDIFNVYNKNGIAQYQVSAFAITEIEEDIRILPNLDATKIYPPKNNFNITNKFALFDSQLSLHYDSLNVKALNNIYKDESSRILSTRYEARTLYVSEFPVEFGIGFNYQSAYWENNREKIRLSILTFGPVFKYKFYEKNNLNFHILLSAEMAPIYVGNSDLYTDKYSAAIIDLGIESHWPSRFGIFSLGSHFRHHNLTLNESDRPNLEITPKEFSLSSLGIMAGYKIEWDL
jgi:hypothetical protein